MKKLFLLIILITAAAIPAVPYFIGTTVEKNFRIEHEEGAREAALSGVELELVDYQRGLFHASATSRISFLIPEGEEKVSVEMHHRISHIPQPAAQVIASVESELLLSSEAAQNVAPLFKGQPVLTAHTRIFLDGHQEGSFDSPAATGEVSGKETVAIEWQGMHGTAWQSPGRDRVTFEMKSPGLVLTPVRNESQPTAKAEMAEPEEIADATDTGASDGATEEDELAAEGEEEIIADEYADDSELDMAAAAQPTLESITLTNLSYEGDMHRGASGMWQGEAKGSLAAFDISLTNELGIPTTMHFDTVTMHGDSSEGNGLMQGGGAFTIKAIDFNGFELSNAVYDITMENIDAGAMRAWQQTAGKMMKGEVDPENPFEPMRPHLPALFNAHPVLKINDLSVDSPMGRFALKMEASVTGEWNEMLLENPALLATQIKANLDASVPRNVVVSALQEKIRNAILAQAAAGETEITPEELEATTNQAVEQQLSGLIAQGFIKENAAQLDSRIEFNAGNLSINGMDASPLMGMIMQ